MKEHIKKLGQKLRTECPDNDCMVYLNIYEMLDGINGDLSGCRISGWGRKVLEREQERLQRELEKMYFTNYAVRKYRCGK